jgi:restriction system-associated AAA family ATPase
MREDANPLEPRLMLIDYSTHFAVLVANLLLGSSEQRAYLLEPANLRDLRSVRCVVQLAHSAVSREVLLTSELKLCLDKLKACATCWNYVQSIQAYTFDFWVDEAVREAFRHHFGTAFELYRQLHKLALLNDLAISRTARQRFKGEVRNRRFASRLPEPPDEDKVFKFEQVTFHTAASTTPQSPVDYVSLSDGEHQLVQIIGMFAMVSEPEVLFLLDEPESHFNPQWRVTFVARLLRVPTVGGDRMQEMGPRSQEVLMTTHAPFVPSDMPRERIVIFERSADGVTPRNPDIQTFGASYEEILDHCFSDHPPISELSREVIDKLKRSDDPNEVQEGLNELGPSVEKVLVAEHLRQLEKD